VSGEPGYLHGHHDSVLRSHRWRTAENSAAYLTPSLEPGMLVLDVGCGPGTITADLAGLVPEGRVIGIDAGAEVLAEAAALSPSTPFLAADLYELPLADASVDVVHLHMVLQHVPDPVAALRALSRVLRPGGLIAARDSDYGAMTWEPASQALERWLALYRDAARASGGEPDAGRYLAGWAEEAGFSAVVSSWSSWIYETAEDRRWWGGLWADRIVASKFADVVEANGLAEPGELESLAEGWRAFAEAPTGRFEIPCGEILCRL
jgi:ubiquinone/menaquinone biosynthesis C-methylase UbiE